MKSWFNKIRGFFREVWEEVLKCTRPTTAELKESTLVVLATMGMIGAFIFVSDFFLSRLLGLLIAAS